jgi:hypothetical protein
MPDIQFQISPAPGVTNDLIAVLYNTIAPAAEVARLLKAPPHASPYNFNFTNQPVGTYIVKIHESPDGVTLGNLRHDFWVNAAINNVQAYTPKTFQVGLGRPAPFYDPADGDTDYINPDLDQLDYLVFKEGFGVLSWDRDITKLSGGGFGFTNGQVFAQDEIYTILISNLTQVTTPGGSSGNSFPNGVVNISGDTTFTSLHYNKVIEVTAVNTCILSISSFDSIPDNTVFSINTHNLVSDDYFAPFYYLIVGLQAGRYLRANGKALNIFHVGRGEEIWVMKSGQFLILLNGGEAYRRVGQIVYTFGEPPLGSLPLTGAWHDKFLFGRLFNYYVNVLPPAELGTGVDDVEPDADNRTKWIIGATKFWVPDHGGVFHRMTDPDGNQDHVRNPGSYQVDVVGPANVKTTAWTGNGLGKSGLVSDGVGFLATHGDGGSVTTDSASGTNRNSARTGTWPIITWAGIDGQTRPRNVAVNAYVLI